MNNPRFAAVRALCEVEKGGYSNIVFADIISEYSFAPRDKALCGALFYGVLDRKITIDYILKTLLTKNSRIKPVTKNALRIGIFQIFFMDKIPSSAAVNESVNIVKSTKDKNSAAFVNAVLRNAVRNKCDIIPQDNSLHSLSVRFSCPEQIVSVYLNDYGLANTVKLLEHSLLAPKLYVRVNTQKTTADELIKLFEELRIKADKTKVENALEIIGGFAVDECDLYKNGYFHVQDLSSQICANSLGVMAGDRVLDACSAPGGKTFTMAQLMGGEGEILACDIHHHRVNLVKLSAQRLGLSNIKTAVWDASEFNLKFGEFDKVLCDVPCSGLGVISRKPDIKYTDYISDELPIIQYKILSNSSRYLKPGGTLVYSTCTLRKAENEDICNKFAAENIDFKIKEMKTFMPHIDGTDGFFVCVFERGKSS